MNDACIPVLVLALGLLGWWWECRLSAWRSEPTPVNVFDGDDLHSTRPITTLHMYGGKFTAGEPPIKPGEAIFCDPDGIRRRLLLKQCDLDFSVDSPASARIEGYLTNDDGMPYVDRTRGAGS